jgi:SPX domain protein involved in polyphosphate accumulation
MEDKYIIPKSLRNTLVDTLEKHLKADYPDSKTKFNMMKSTYFDSSNLDMVRHHLSKATSRFKLRTREYAPDGKLQKTDYAFLEIKAKHDNITDKFRIRVPKEDMETFKKGSPITPTVRLAKMNPNIALPDLVKRIIDINQAMELFHLRPSCETQYVRRAYTDGAVNDSGLRVTFDENVKYNVLDVVPTGVRCELNKAGEESDELLNMVDSYSPDEHIIVEVKHHGTVPDWLNKFVNDHKLQKAAFSKYCYSVAKHTLSKSNPYGKGSKLYTEHDALVAQKRKAKNVEEVGEGPNRQAKEYTSAKLGTAAQQATNEAAEAKRKSKAMPVSHPINDPKYASPQSLPNKIPKVG